MNMVESYFFQDFHSNRFDIRFISVQKGTWQIVFVPIIVHIMQLTCVKSQLNDSTSSRTCSAECCSDVKSSWVPNICKPWQQSGIWPKICVANKSSKKLRTGKLKLAVFSFLNDLVKAQE